MTPGDIRWLVNDSAEGRRFAGLVVLAAFGCAGEATMNPMKTVSAVGCLLVLHGILNPATAQQRFVQVDGHVGTSDDGPPDVSVHMTFRPLSGQPECRHSLYQGWFMGSRMQISRSLVLLPLVMVLAGCGNDSTGPTNASVAGPYVASVFTVRQGSGPTVDLLARGASIDVTLSASGGVTGQLVVPGTPEFGTGLTADLAGTYTISGNTLRFSQSADTFIRDIDWTIGDNVLTASGDAGGGAIAAVRLIKAIVN